MAQNSTKCVLNIRNFPTELRRKLKARAADLGIDLQDLVIEYLRAGLNGDRQQAQEPQQQPSR